MSSSLSIKEEFKFEALYKTLVGSKIKIIESKNPNQIGKSGIVIHESANFLVLRGRWTLQAEFLKET